MTLSILIPTYNYNARALVEQLVQLAQADGITAEVLVGDDASTDETAWLEEVVSLPTVSVLRAHHNLGRSANRNRLADAAQGEWLLFMDCDAEVIDSHFLSNYMKATAEADVICGGLCHPRQLPRQGCELRWRYELSAEPSFAANHLNHLLQMGKRVPFRTFSFLIRRDIFQQVRFDERIQAYGCEDVQFGQDLEKQGIKVLYIDNPLLNGDIEPNPVFLSKTEEALRTLHGIQGHLQGYYTIENVAARLRRWHLKGVIKGLFQLFHKPMRRNLLSSNPNLKVFAFYKLGYYLSL
jgi:GT2 family glycosyltransferase